MGNGTEDNSTEKDRYNEIFNFKFSQNVIDVLKSKKNCNVSEKNGITIIIIIATTTNNNNNNNNNKIPTFAFDILASG